jgi:hypothetical protein
MIAKLPKETYANCIADGLINRDLVVVAQGARTRAPPPDISYTHGDAIVHTASHHSRRCAAWWAWLLLYILALASAVARF